MCDWYTINLGDPQLAHKALAQLESVFEQQYSLMGKPQDMALFVRHESGGRLHCEVNVYFSPKASPVAKAAEANRCKKPFPHDLGLLAGSPAAWEKLFYGLNSDSTRI